MADPTPSAHCVCGQPCQHCTCTCTKAEAPKPKRGPTAKRGGGQTVELR